MSVDPDWEELVRGYRQYRLARDRLFDRDPVPALRTALKSGTSRIALSELARIADQRPDLVRQLIPELFWYAQGVSPDCGTARRILRVLDGNELEPHLQSLVAEFLADPNNDWEEYRGVAELLDTLELDALLDQVRAVARSSASIDMREVAEDYPRRERTPARRDSYLAVTGQVLSAWRAGRGFPFCVRHAGIAVMWWRGVVARSVSVCLLSPRRRLSSLPRRTPSCGR